MELLSRFNNYIRSEDLFHAGDKLILAVSGGVDSIVLTELCKRAGYKFIIAHCNFNLRPGETDAEKKLVGNLANEMGCELFIKEFETSQYASEKNLSIQVAARQLRYEWFNELIKETNSRFIVTAHHADDNIETLLMNFFRGTGIRGLKAILPRQSNIVRPLLFAKKTELEDFARQEQLKYLTDSSNLTDKYTRNYFRHQVIPLIEKVFPSAEENLTDNIARFREIESLYDEAISVHKKKLLEYKGTEIHIPVNKLAKIQALKSVVYEIIKDYDFSSAQADDVIKLLSSESGRYIDSASHRILKNRNWIIISKKQEVNTEHILIEDETSPIIFAEEKIVIEKISAQQYRISSAPTIAQVDASLIRFPLLLRNWKMGDYFYPLGMKKKKKLSRFLIDMKISKNDKQKIRVIEMDKKIIWIAGLRIDERFKITASTKEILRMELFK